MMTDGIWKSEERAQFALRSLYHRYGYAPYKMSHFEEYDLYVRNKDFLVSDQIITFSGAGGQLLALKPDVTLSIVKNAPQTPGVVQKVYYSENVYRDYREIMQTGLECVGDLGEYEMAEVVLLAVKSLALLDGRYVLNLSHMGLIAAVLNGSGLTGQVKRQAMDCLRRKNAHELKNLCGGQEEIWKKLEALVSCRGSGRDVLGQLSRVLTADAERQALAELESLWGIPEGAGQADHVRLGIPGRDSRQHSLRGTVRQASPEDGPEESGHRVCHLPGSASGAGPGRQRL